MVPDAITRALELEKGSADVCINCMTADMVYVLGKRANLQVESGPGTNLNYISFNTQDAVLRDVRVRQAIAFAMNRPLIIHSLWRDRARLAETSASSLSAKAPLMTISSTMTRTSTSVSMDGKGSRQCERQHSGTPRVPRAGLRYAAKRTCPEPVHASPPAAGRRRRTSQK